MRKALLIVPVLIGIASSNWFTSILRGLLESGKPSMQRFIAAVPSEFLHELENDDQQAGQFVCDIVAGNIPGAFENLAADITQDVEEGFSEITSFIAALPTLAPEILENILSDGEDVVSVVEELFTNPGGVVTLIVSDVSVIVSDITSEAESIWHGFTCLFKPKKACSSSTADLAASLSDQCAVVRTAATTTWSPAAASATYTPAQPTAAASSYGATPTTQGVYQCTSVSSCGSGSGGDGGSGASSGGGVGIVLHAWFGLLFLLVGCIIML